jgi:hypothetical protein
MSSGIYDCVHAVGGMTADYVERDPKRMVFVLARYKVVAKLLEGKLRILEVGCADGFGTRIVRQHVTHVTAIDIDHASIEEAKAMNSKTWPVDFYQADILEDAFGGFDAVYCLDVFEHMDPATEENVFLERLWHAAPVAIIGTPSLESQVYASELSRKGHCNCVSKSGLRERMQRYWSQVFVLGMNDELLHVGHDGMTHYLLGIGCR